MNGWHQKLCFKNYSSTIKAGFNRLYQEMKIFVVLLMSAKESLPFFSVSSIHMFLDQKISNSFIELCLIRKAKQPLQTNFSLDPFLFASVGWFTTTKPYHSTHRAACNHKHAELIKNKKSSVLGTADSTATCRKQRKSVCKAPWRSEPSSR